MLCHKAVRDISHFLSDCEALDGERKALKSILRDVANETFTTEVLNSIKDNQVVKQVVSMWRFREDLLVWLSFTCSFRCTCYLPLPWRSSLLVLLFCLVICACVLFLCSAIMGKPYKSTVKSNNNDNNMYRTDERKWKLAETTSLEVLNLPNKQRLLQCY